MAAPAAATTPPPAPARRRLPRFDLSATQLLATGLAAITATFLASYLGVSGTIIGAAVASVATAIGNAVYGQSLRHTRDRVRDVVPLVLRTDPASPTVVLPTTAGGSEQTRTDDVRPELPAGRPRRARPTAPAGQLGTRVALVATGLFVALLTLITTVELITGRPVTDLVRGDSGAGTTLFGTTAPRTAAPVPTVTVTVVPKVVTTTPTVVRTAPATTRTVPASTSTTTAGTSPGSGAPSSGVPATPSSSPTPTDTPVP